MDRAQWRRERRLWNEVQMDTIHARQYDEHSWLAEKQFSLLEVTEGDGYRHYLTRKQ